ncbi:hypothetical protein LZK73_20435 [Neorhizobium galegae]|nr:hypothetical protein LZK73_20435 [Neorhizobium galegae]
MTTRLRPIRISLLGLLAAAILSGCESSSVADKVLDDKALKPPPSVVEETFGRGSTEVTVLLTKAPNGTYEGLRATYVTVRHLPSANLTMPAS